MNIPSRRIVVPVDFSEMSLQAARTARDLLADDGELHIVHVLAPIIASEPGVIWGRVDDSSRKEHAREALRKALGEHQIDPAEIHLRLSASGNAAWEIVRLSEDLEAELIVLPSHGRHGLSRLAIGSVAERVVRYAHCPVLVLRD